MASLQMRAVAANALQDEGWSVLEASDMEEAGFILSKADRPLGLVICDYVIGGRSGREMVQELLPGESVSSVFVLDAWSYVPGNLRGAFPREEVMEGPLTPRGVLEVVNKSFGRRKHGVTEDFRVYG